MRFRNMGFAFTDTFLQIPIPRVASELHEKQLLVWV